jgi:hypothetical protein
MSYHIKMSTCIHELLRCLKLSVRSLSLSVILKSNKIHFKKYIKPNVLFYIVNAHPVFFIEVCVTESQTCGFLIFLCVTLMMIATVIETCWL